MRQRKARPTARPAKPSRRCATASGISGITRPLPEAVDIPDDQTDDIHVLLDSDGNAISLYHFSIVEETEEWLLTVGVGLGVRGYAAGISSGYGHISPNGPNVGFTALNRSTNGRFILIYDGATTGLVRADSRTLYIRQRGTDGNWHVVQMDEIATPYEYVSTTNGHNFTFREGTAYNVIVRRAADTNDGGNIAAVLTTDRDVAFEDGASLVQLADVQDLLHIGEVVEVVYQQVAGLAAAEVTVDASAFTGNLSADRYRRADSRSPPSDALDARRRDRRDG